MQFPQSTRTRPQSASDAGWPRPKRNWQSSLDRRAGLPDRLPAPWINGPCIESDGDWHNFREDATRAHYERLCPVCGEPNGDIIVLGRYSDNHTSGPGGHPRCLWLAANSCPRLVENGDDVAWLYVGKGTGYINSDSKVEESYGGGEELHPSCSPLTRAKLKELARANPLGVA